MQSVGVDDHIDPAVKRHSFTENTYENELFSWADVVIGPYTG